MVRVTGSVRPKTMKCCQKGTYKQSKTQNKPQLASTLTSPSAPASSLRTTTQGSTSKQAPPAHDLTMPEQVINAINIAMLEQDAINGGTAAAVDRINNACNIAMLEQDMIDSATAAAAQALASDNVTAVGQVGSVSNIAMLEQDVNDGGFKR